MALKSIEEEWEGFALMIFRNVKPSQVQVEEMKKAFFAGAWTILNANLEIGEPHISEEQGMAWLDARFEEGKAFYQKLIAEYAAKN